MKSCDTNIFVYYFDTSCVEHKKAAQYLSTIAEDSDFILCDLVLTELYVLLQNKKVFSNPKSKIEALNTCLSLRSNPWWQILEYTSGAMGDVWSDLKALSKSSSRTESRQSPVHIYDRRLASVLRKQGVVEFATRNVKDFKGLGFNKVINPID